MCLWKCYSRHTLFIHLHIYSKYLIVQRENRSSPNVCTRCVFLELAGRSTGSRYSWCSQRLASNRSIDSLQLTIHKFCCRKSAPHFLFGLQGQGIKIFPLLCLLLIGRRVCWKDDVTAACLHTAGSSCQVYRVWCHCRLICRLERNYNKLKFTEYIHSQISFISI